MKLDKEEHQANDNILKNCDFCGECAELSEGVCEQCKIIRAENRRQIDEKLEVV